ncbi:hypothetical protein [Breznakiella homolactica]|uniref:Lipoprotein n=1 Tax=Breznakiella homolactica TaxID=2798577 RepID=A0A7T8B851_9SPIR|nr:hypothetical protein [Breznakiella homolactica]QQO08209.1 hypothetical protein JFL75_14890 [Breznakiella homolactica]
MRFFLRNIIPLVLPAVFLWFSFSCSQSAPQIARGTLRLEYYPSGTGSGVEERYSLYILPEDADGLEDLAVLYLYHDREELRWKLTNEDWRSEIVNGETWIGTNAIAMIDGERLPRGQFRAVLEDKGGSRGERTVSFDGPVSPRHDFPVFSVSDGMYRYTSAYPVNRLVCYSENGIYLRTLELPEPEGDIESLGLPRDARAAALWAEDPEYQTSALTDVVPLR